MADRPTKGRFAPFARLVGHRPSTGAKQAALNVFDEAKGLIRAEIQLAKAELTAIAKDKAIGAIFFVVAALMAYFGAFALLFCIGAVIALWLPVWAAAGIITLVLFLIAAIAAFIGYRQMKIEAMPANTTKQFERSTESTQRAVNQLKHNYRMGAKEAAHNVTTSVKDAVPEKVRSKVPQRLIPQRLRNTSTSPRELP